MGQNRAENRFFIIFSKFGPLVFLEIAQDDSLEHFLTTSRGKNHGKKFGDPNWIRNQGSCHFRKVASYFLDIAQDCSFGQCQTSSGAETSKKIFLAETGT